MRPFNLRVFLVVVVAVLLCLPLFGQSAQYAQSLEPGSEVARVLKIPSLEPEADVIIELAEPPLLERRRARERTNASAATLDELLVRLEGDIARMHGSDGDRVAANAAGHRIGFRYKLAFAGASAHVHREDIARIRALPYVKAVHVDQQIEAHVDKSVPKIGAPEVWQQLGLRGRGVTIAIIDTGIDYNHAALGKGFGPGFKVAGGYDFHNDDADPMDDNGHGTHVAGIAAGETAPVVGVAPGATLLAYKVLDQNGEGKASTILAAIDRAADPNGDGDPSDRADVVNMSLGGRPILDDPLVAAVERAIAAGVVFAISAGNARINGSIGSPGISPSAVTVGATNLNDAAAFFTSRGPVGRTWLLKPEVSAPGVKINSARRTGGSVSASGTSMAAPHVAGLAALIIERHPDWTPEEVKSAIVSTAVPVMTLEEAEYEQPTRILAAGIGRIDARRAVDATLLSSPAAVSFGLLPRRFQPWTVTRTLRLVNRGTAPETLTPKFSELPAGATLSATPPSVTIAPGESATVELRLELAKNTPNANEDFTALTGTIEMEGSRGPLRIPWLIVNVGVMSVKYGGSDPFAIVLHSTANPLLAWQEADRAIAAFVPYEFADVLILSSDGPGEQLRIIVREQLPVEGHTQVNLSAADAVHTVDFDTVDVRGVPFSELATPGTASRGIINHFIKLPSWGRYWLEQPEWSRTLRVSSMPATELRSFETLLTGDDLYVSMYPIRYGITENVRTAWRATDWASQKVQHDCETACEVHVGIPTGSVHYAPYHALPQGGAVRTFHMAHPEAADGLDFRMYMAVREQDAPSGPSNPWSLFSGPWRNVGGRLTVSPFGRLSKVDYVSPAPSIPIRHRQGPVTLRVAMGPRNFIIEPSGPLGDNLGVNVLNVEAAVYDETGQAISSQMADSQYRINRRDTGPYRLVASDVYPFEGMTARVTMTGVGNSSVYASPPTLSTLRVEDGRGALTTAVPAGSPARVVFSARQSTIDTYYVVHGPVVPNATKAWWRPHGSAEEWQPVPVTLTTQDFLFAWDQFPGAPGAIYAADLRAATSRPGGIDLKIQLANEWGATSEIVYEPVMMVTPPATRRRSVR